MIFIYDILLNFNDQELHEFYEWSSNDDIEYVKKIPVLRLQEKCYYEIKNNDVLLDKAALEKIYQQCEIIHKKRVKKIPYGCLFTNLKEVFAVMLDSDGRILMRSTLLLDEGYDVIEKTGGLKITIIEYKVLKKNKQEPFLTRKEKDIIYFLNKEIDNIYNNRKFEKLRYLYYECFNLFGNNIDYIYEIIKEFINKEWTNKHLQLYNLVKLSYTKK